MKQFLSGIVDRSPYVHRSKIRGAGGLPVGVAGKVVALLSAENLGVATEGKEILTNKLNPDRDYSFQTIRHIESGIPCEILIGAEGE